jgi:hypothetical protein
MNDLDLGLDDIVMFELPAPAHVDAFDERFRPRWDVWSHADEQGWLFAALVNTGDGNFASLLRESQELLAELGLAEIRFWVDGRVYLLDAARASESRSAATAA